MYAPVVVFAYNRSTLLSKCIEHLLSCPEARETELYIFCDGPKDNTSEEERNSVSKTQYVAQTITGFKHTHVVVQTTNAGLKQSVLNGLTQVFKSNAYAIIIEDDIMVGNQFLTFMNQALPAYADETKVAGISGYSFPIGEFDPYFSRTGSCWGWATYSRVWNDFLKSRAQLDLSLIDKNELNLFNVYQNIYSDMFKQSKQSLIQSWAVEFYLYYFTQKQFFLMPGGNLISNLGFDGSGVHSKHGNFLTDDNPIGAISSIHYPYEIKEDIVIRKKIEKLYRKGYAKQSFIGYFVSKMKRLLLGDEKVDR